MTPARRKRLIRTICVITVVLFIGLACHAWYHGQNIPALIMGRKPGSANPGTALVHTPPVTSTNTQPPSPSTVHKPLLQNQSPLKLKFDVLGGWKYIEGKKVIPENVRQLDGKWVEITGFMLPINEIKNITRFIVIQSLWGCCFGQTPDVNHVIVVTMEPGKSVEFYPDPVRVVGRFSVGETREEGYLISIYCLEASQVLVR